MFKRSKAIENDGFGGDRFGSSLFVKEETVSTQPFAEELDGGVRDTGLPRDLAKARTRDQAMKDGLEEVAAAKPVGGREGL